MKQLLRICLTGAFFLLFEGLLSPMLADNGKSDKEILVLNSINFNLPSVSYTHLTLPTNSRV